MKYRVYMFNDSNIVNVCLTITIVDMFNDSNIEMMTIKILSLHS